MKFFNRIRAYFRVTKNREWPTVINKRKQRIFCEYLDTIQNLGLNGSLQANKEKTNKKNFYKMNFNNLIVKYALEHLKDTNNNVKQYKKELLKNLEIVDDNLYSVNEWLGIYKFLNKYTDSLVLNYKFKEIALSLAEKLYNKEGLKPTEIDLMLKALFELGELQKIKNFIESSYLLKMYAFFINIHDIKLIINYFYDNYPKKRFKINSNFYKLVNNKNILIIGPTDNHELSITNYHQFDLIVKFNYLLGNKSLPSKDDLLTSYKLISYYWANDDKLITEFNYEIFSNLLFIVSNNKLAKALKKEAKKHDNKFREITLLKTSFVTSYNHLQRATLDLLQYNPKSINITNATFYYKDNYKSDYVYNNDTKEIYRNLIISHDQIMQVRLIKNLYIHGLIKVDKKIEFILNLDEEKYLKTLENQFFSGDLIKKIE